MIEKHYSTIVAPAFSCSGGGASLQQVSIPLTAAQVLGMFAASITVVPAPSSNQGLVLVNASIEVLPGSTAFAAGGPVQLIYHGGSTNLMSGQLAAATVNATANSPATLTTFDAATAAGGIVVPPGVGIDVQNLTAAFTTGNGQLFLFLTYETVNLN